MKYYIYTLSHPITNEVRYVGKTINIKRRYKQHLYDKRGSHKSNWVQSIRKQNLKPILTILEECNDNWQNREIYWISQFDNLTNFLSGGQNSYRPPTSEETKEKIRQANIGKKLSKNHKNNISHKMKKKRISIKGVIYESFSIANKKTGINLSTLHYRINNPKINDYFYI